MTSQSDGHNEAGDDDKNDEDHHQVEEPFGDHQGFTQSDLGIFDALHRRMDRDTNSDHPADPDDGPQDVEKDDEMRVVLKQVLHNGSFNSEKIPPQYAGNSLTDSHRGIAIPRYTLYLRRETSSLFGGPKGTTLHIYY